MGNTLFDNEESTKQRKSFLRDSSGRFASKITSRIEQAERSAKAYMIMYRSELSRKKGFSSIIRKKDEEIQRLKEIINQLKNNINL